MERMFPLLHLRPGMSYPLQHLVIPLRRRCLDKGRTGGQSSCEDTSCRATAR